ncbi:MAG: hypothetical protein IT245_03795 [Bacteroidia bacterium]|nr:hypothetical protein [Bacteroidia bacterium]
MEKNFKPGQLVRYLKNGSDFTIMVTTDDIPFDDADSFAGTVVKSVSSTWEVGHHFNRWSKRYFTLVDKVDANTPELDAMQRLQSLMPKSVLVQYPDNMRLYFYLDKDSRSRNMPYTEQKKDENVSTFIDYTIGRLQDDGLLARATVGPVTKSKVNITEELTDFDEPRIYDQLPEKEKQAYNRLKNLIPGSQVVVNLNNGVNTFYLDRNTEYTIQLQNESFIEFINRTIEKLYDTKRISEPNMAKDAAERIDQYVSGYTTDEVLSINRLRKLMPGSSLTRNKFDKKHIFYIRAEDTWYVGRAYTVQNKDEDVMQFIERTISKLYQDKTIGNTSGDDIAKEDNPNRTHIPKSNITTCPTVSEKLPPIPQPRDLCMPIPIPEGHVRVALYLGDFDQCISTSFPARVNKKDEFILNLYLEDENDLSSAALLAVNQQETWVCYRTQWERDEEGSYQIAYIK